MTVTPQTGAVQGAPSFACGCIGPQNGEPLCPCMMRNVYRRDDRWVRREQDLGPVLPSPSKYTFPAVSQRSHGCICPAGAEKTCAGPLCPRRPVASAAGSAPSPSKERREGE